MRQIGVAALRLPASRRSNPSWIPVPFTSEPFEAPAWANLKAWPPSRHPLTSTVDQPPSRRRFGAEVNLEWTARAHKPSC
jgi:hypothetical protein